MKQKIGHMESGFTQNVWSATQKIPRGRVATYTAIAAATGNPRASRAVGNALGRNRNAAVPCHRVVRSDGSVGGFAHGTAAKINRLEKEGVVVTNGYVEKKFIVSKI